MAKEQNTFIEIIDTKNSNINFFGFVKGKTWKKVLDEQKRSSE